MQQKGLVENHVWQPAKVCLREHDPYLTKCDHYFDVWMLLGFKLAEAIGGGADLAAPHARSIMTL